MEKECLRLTIEWGGPGTPIKVTGPVHDKMLCYAMMEGAKDAIRDHLAQQRQPSITVAQMSDLPGINNGHAGS